MALADLHPQDQLYVAYLACQMMLVFSFAAWFVARLPAIMAANGGLDLYLNFTFRLFPFQLGLLLIWLAADAGLGWLLSAD